MSTQAIQIIRDLMSQCAAQQKPLRPSEFVTQIWQRYQANYLSDNNLNGKVFEEIVALTLIQSDVLPFYMQAHVAFIPNVNYDFILYNETSIVSLSAKVSLRERWKQADLEAVALRYIHRNAKSFVVTLNEQEAATRNQKLGECMGIHRFVVATSPEFDTLIAELKGTQFQPSPQVSVVSSRILIDVNSAAIRYAA